MGKISPFSTNSTHCNYKEKVPNAFMFTINNVVTNSTVYITVWVQKRKFNLIHFNRASKVFSYLCKGK